MLYLQIEPIKIGKGEWACPFCPRIMRDSYDIKKHIRIHTGEKPFQCSICGQKFNRKEILKTHQQKIHNLFI